MRFGQFVLNLPEWVEGFGPPGDHVFTGDEDKMRLIVELSRQNASRGGGPFAAGVFGRDTGLLIAVGLNLVVQANCSIAHAEIVAIALAQQKLGSYDLGAENMPACELVTSTAPCAMCLGAIPWSGVRRLVCGARDADARSVGFDEGQKPPEWIEALQARGIAVVTDVLRDEAKAVLHEYRDGGGDIYNGRRGPGQ